MIAYTAYNEIEEFVQDIIRKGIDSVGLDLIELNLTSNERELVDVYMKEKNYSFPLALRKEDRQSSNYITWLEYEV